MKKAKDTLPESYVLVKSSQLQALRYELRGASRALFHLESLLSNIALTSMPRDKEGTLFAKLMDTSDTKQNEQSCSKNSDSGESEKHTEEISKNTDLRSEGSANGQTKKSQKK